MLCQSINHLDGFLAIAAIDWTPLLVGAGIGALISAVVGLFAVSVFQPATDRLVFGLMTFARGGRTIQATFDGIWFSHYEYRHANRPDEVLVDEHFFVARERRGRLHAYSLPRDVPSRLTIALEIDGDVLTGTWRESTPGLRLYHGAAQFAAQPTRDGLVGAWLGYSVDGGVQSGPWELTRVDRSVSRRARREYSHRPGLKWSELRDSPAAKSDAQETTSGD